MRLKCPNCGAQYEVDSTVIPDMGRDVQCSNCGHTWFQNHSAQEIELDEQQVRDEAASPAQDTPTPPPAPTVEARDIPPPEDTFPEPPELADPEPATPPRQSLDQGAADVLREEAELEFAQRSPASPAQDVQLDPEPQIIADRGRDEVVERPTLSQELDAEKASYDSKRKDLLPDIEEINSTLAASGSAIDTEEDDDATVEVRRRSGFRIGFVAAVAIFGTLALTYVYAPKIADSVPGTANSLVSYVDWINGLRASVDGVMLGAVEKLTGILAQISGDKPS
jgi:predicted Zn finger-like uncharacterized protein